MVISGHFVIDFFESISPTSVWPPCRQAPVCLARSRQRARVKRGQHWPWQSCSSGCCSHRDPAAPLKKIREGHLECALSLTSPFGNSAGREMDRICGRTRACVPLFMPVRACSCLSITESEAVVMVPSIYFSMRSCWALHVVLVITVMRGTG